MTSLGKMGSGRPLKGTGWSSYGLRVRRADLRSEEVGEGRVAGPGAQCCAQDCTQMQETAGAGGLNPARLPCLLPSPGPQHLSRELLALSILCPCCARSLEPLWDFLLSWGLVALKFLPWGLAL